mgnify:CR=1 FL=1
MAKLAEGRKWQNRVLHASRNTVERLYSCPSATGRSLNQGVGQILAGSHNQRGVTASGIGPHTTVRAGNRNCGNHLTGSIANRRGNRTHALIAFIDRLGPAALADGGELGRSELGVAKTLMQAFGILPSQQNLGCGTGSMDSIAPTGMESRKPEARSTAAMHTRISP